MRPIMRMLGTCVVTLLAVVLSSGVASACSCAAMTMAEQVDRAGIVVRGTFERIEAPDEAGRNAGDPAVYTLVPTHVWKGDVIDTFTVVMAPDGAACGLEGFREGSDVVLFATDYGEGLTADLCGGTSAATSDLVDEVSGILGAGEPVTVIPSDPVPETTPADREPNVGGAVDWAGPTITTAAAVLLAGSLVALWRLWPRKRP